MDLGALSDEGLDRFQKEFERLRKLSARNTKAVERIERKKNGSG